MAGRGRGGGGRGRGRGLSFDPRDMGFAPGEQVPANVIQPPPTFPPLDFQPVPMQSNPEMEYMVALKKDLVISFKDRWSVTDKEDEVKCFQSQIDWRLIPAELKLNTQKRAAKKALASLAKKGNFDLNALDALAKLEDTEESEAEKVGGEKGKEDKEEENEIEDEEEDMDEEMDDGTDYVNNYFDNGEGFDDDDDNGNDGPVF